MSGFLNVILNLFWFCRSYFSNFQIIYPKWRWDTSKCNFWCLGNLRLATVSILRNYAILTSSYFIFLHDIFYLFSAPIPDESFKYFHLFWLILLTNNFWSLCNSKRRLRHSGHTLSDMLETTRILKIRKKRSIVSWGLSLNFFLIMRWTHDVFFR